MASITLKSPDEKLPEEVGGGGGRGGDTCPKGETPEVMVRGTPGDGATKHPDESYSEFYACKGRGLTYDEATLEATGETKTSDVVVPPPGDVHHQMFKVAQMAFHKMASQFINCSEGIRSLEYNAEKSTEKKCIYNFEYFWTGGLVLFFSFFLSFLSFFSFFFRWIHCAFSHTRY